MNQKRAKRLRRMLRDERNETAPLAVEKNIEKPLPQRLLMRRKDPNPNELGPRLYRGGAILHPMSDRAVYQFAKRKAQAE
jgi:hypothetical protein